MNTLIVEPDLAFVAALSEALAQEGHFLTGIAITRPDAAELVATRTPDLAFVAVDILGRDLEPHLLWSMQRHALPAVLIVRDHAEAGRFGALALGSLKKPIAPDALRLAVRALAAQLSGRAPAAVPPELALSGRAPEKA